MHMLLAHGEESLDFLLQVGLLSIELIIFHLLGPSDELSDVLEDKGPHSRWKEETYHEPAEEAEKRCNEDWHLYSDLNRSIYFLADRIYFVDWFTCIHERKLESIGFYWTNLACVGDNWYVRIVHRCI